MTPRPIHVVAFLALALGSPPACPETPRSRIAFFRTEPGLTCHEIGSVRLGEVVLAQTPFLTDAKILDYDWESHTLLLSKLDRTGLRCLDVRGCGFVLVVDHSRVYAGVIMSPFSSFACPLPSIVFPTLDEVDGERARSNTLRVFLSYPGMPTEGVDLRSDRRLRTALRELGKLSPVD